MAYSYDRRKTASARFYPSKHTENVSGKVPFPVILDDKDGPVADEEGVEAAILEAIHDESLSFYPTGDEDIEEVEVPKVQMEFKPFWDKKQGGEGTDAQLKEAFEDWVKGKPKVWDEYVWTDDADEESRRPVRRDKEIPFKWVIDHHSGFKVVWEAAKR